MNTTALRSYAADPRVPPFPDDRPLLLFDGECVLCSGWARFVLKHDKGRIRLSVTQSSLGRALYAHYRLDPDETNLFLTNGRAFARSDAVLQVLSALGPPWSAATVMSILPRPLRDAAYGVLARNRFRVFGRRETCMIPPPGHAGRFLA